MIPIWKFITRHIFSSGYIWKCFLKSWAVPYHPKNIVHPKNFCLNYLFKSDLLLMNLCLESFRCTLRWVTRSASPVKKFVSPWCFRSKFQLSSKWPETCLNHQMCVIHLILGVCWSWCHLRSEENPPQIYIVLVLCRHD